MNTSSRTTDAPRVSTSTDFLQNPSESDATLWPLRECAPWCVDGKGHSDKHPVDRDGTSRDFYVPLTLGKPQDYGDDYGNPGGRPVWRIPWLEVFLRREPQENQQRVCLSSEHLGGETIEMTPDEARTLIAALSSALELLG